ncbi:DUF3224 domain-containing protein [Streptomyces sp. NPDC086554]|uniref:DUF3224 domain-containing protein n=1 Tax=Streptomyces sp. NPDC086554 TaxID=3154864 RepID=UPI003432DA3F
MRASGTFKVVDFTPAPVPSPAIETAVPVGVATMDKQFEGEIAGRSATLFTSAFDQSTNTGTYVAMESFERAAEPDRGVSVGGVIRWWRNGECSPRADAPAIQPGFRRFCQVA